MSTMFRCLALLVLALALLSPATCLRQEGRALLTVGSYGEVERDEPRTRDEEPRKRDEEPRTRDESPRSRDEEPRPPRRPRGSYGEEAAPSSYGEDAAPGAYGEDAAPADDASADLLTEEEAVAAPESGSAVIGIAVGVAVAAVAAVVAAAVFVTKRRQSAAAAAALASEGSFMSA